MLLASCSVSDSGQRRVRAITSSLLGQRSVRRADSAALGENQDVILYGNVLNALEKTEEAAKGLDVERARRAHAVFEKLYEQTH